MLGYSHSAANMWTMPKLGFSLEQIRTFIAVSKTGNISLAAAALHLTQGAVSQQIHNLERALGVQLVERSGRGIRITKAGRAVADACVASARSLQGIMETASHYSDAAIGSLDIGASPTAAGYYLPSLLGRFLALFPEIEIRVSTANSPTIAEQVANGVLDCGFVELPAQHSNLVEHKVHEDQIVLVVHRDHPLARSSIISAEALAAHRYIAREPGSAHESAAHEILGDAYGHSRRIEVGHLDAVRANTLEGLGYSIMPMVAIAAQLEDGTLRRLSWPGKSLWIRAIRRESLRSPCVEAFWHLLATPREAPGQLSGVQAGDDLEPSAVTDDPGPVETMIPSPSVR